MSNVAALAKIVVPVFHLPSPFKQIDLAKVNYQRDDVLTRLWLFPKFFKNHWSVFGADPWFQKASQLYKNELEIHFFVNK